MSVVIEVSEAINLVAGAIKNIKDIHTALKDGKMYFEKKHPEIKKDVQAMCAELQKTCSAIVIASSVVTNFKFDASPAVIELQPTRFNDYCIHNATSRVGAEDLIRSLKGHCSVIRGHAEKLTQGKPELFWRFFGLSAAEKEVELGEKLMDLYNDEKEFHITVGKMASSIEKAFTDVTDTLCSNGLMHASNVPEAAAKLGAYSLLFRELKTKAEQTRDDIGETMIELEG
jgi:hypothetical protein